jgi:hypothetical protein
VIRQSHNGISSVEPSAQVGAAVDEDRLAGDVGAVVGEQERHHSREVL